MRLRKGFFKAGEVYIITAKTVIGWLLEHQSTMHSNSHLMDSQSLEHSKKKFEELVSKYCSRATIKPIFRAYQEELERDLDYLEVSDYVFDTQGSREYNKTADLLYLCKVAVNS